MASIFAILAGLKHAKGGKPPYAWALVTNPGRRAWLLRDGWKSVGKVFVLAIVIDGVNQWIVPVNVTYSKVTKMGGQLLSFTGGVRGYLEAPASGPDWGVRLVVTLLYPK